MKYFEMNQTIPISLHSNYAISVISILKRVLPSTTSVIFVSVSYKISLRIQQYQKLTEMISNKDKNNYYSYCKMFIQMWNLQNYTILYITILYYTITPGLKTTNNG